MGQSVSNVFTTPVRVMIGENLRLKYEPDAYDDKRAEDEARIEAGWKAYKAYNRQRNDIAYQEAVQEEDPVKMFETVAEILAQPPEERICIPTGADSV